MKAKSQKTPPAWADNLLRRFSDPRRLEEVQGDLHEAFHKRCHSHSVARVKAYFVLDVLRSMTLGPIDNPFQTPMLSSYFKSGWRNFLKYKSYSVTNVFGLSIGFASALLLFLIIRYEHSFDRFHTKVDRVYRVGNSFKGGGFDDMIVTPQIPLMEKEYPDILHASRFHGSEDILGHDDTFVRTSYHVVDPGFAEMFDFPMVAGDLRKALASPNQIVLTKSKARELFGDADALGKTVRLVNEKTEFTVAAVAEDPPKNSTLAFEVLIPWANAPNWLDIDQAGNWYNTFMVGYVELAPEASKEALEKKLVAFKDAHFLEERRATWSVLLLPLRDEHFRQSGNQGMNTILAIIAGALLLISCINFTNLSIAQTLKRTREVGLRRVLGSLKHHVTLQFLTEGLITCAVAMVIGIGVAWLALPYVNEYYGFGVTLDLQGNETFIGFLAGICMLPALFASLAPSLAISGVKPINAIKGVIRRGPSGESVWRTLIVLQFTASIVLLIGTAIIWQQTRYMKSHNLKFDRANVAVIDAWPELFRDPERARQGFLALRKELEKETAIEAASFVSGVPGEYDENYNGFSDGNSPTGESVSLRKVHVDDEFFRTFGMRVLKGRSFSPEIESDKHAVIINQAAMKAFGWTDIEDKELIEGGGSRRVAVIGVVEDYYYQSLKRSIQPLVHFYTPDNIGRLAVKLKAGRIEEGLALLKSKWDALGPYEPFNYHFVDKSFDNLYKEQDRLSATSSLFSLVAVAISSLGLISITAYSIRLRRKEVSIRKVLGATVPGIILKLSRAYGILVLIGFVLACPVVYYLANSFLDGFAYRIELSPVVFAAVGVGIFMLAMSIVAWVSGSVALENPVDALKDE